MWTISPLAHTLQSADKLSYATKKDFILTMSEKPLTYTSYLKVDELLALQQPESVPVEHDEMLFIVIHQVYELWFKQMLHELNYLCQLLQQGDTHKAQHTLRRVLTILKTVVSQIDVLETMTPLEFNSFRSFLSSASGFQSAQFRALEFMLGYKRVNMLHHFPQEAPQRALLEQLYHAPSLWDAFLHYLHGQGAAVPSALLARDVTQPIEPNAALQSVLIALYREGAPAAQVCERLIDLDEGLQEWRYRHVKMVERTIGAKMGTGGSSGVKYLASTVQPMFPDLWAIRSEL